MYEYKLHQTNKSIQNIKYMKKNFLLSKMNDKSNNNNNNNKR